MKKKIMSLLLAACLMVVTSVAAVAADVTTFSGEATREGDTVTVVLSVDNAGATSGQLTLGYDADQLELVSAEFGAAVSGLVEAGDPNSINTAESGVVTAGFASLTATEAGEVLVVTFTAQGETPAEGYSFPMEFTEWSTEGKDSLLENASGAKGTIVLKGEASDYEPEDPSGSTTEPENPGSSTTKPEDDGSSTGGSKTGDTAPIAALMIVMAVAAAGIVIVLVVRKRCSK